MTDTPVPRAEQIAAVTRLIERCEARSAYLQGHHGRASILIESNDFAAMREILATLEQHERAMAVDFPSVVRAACTAMDVHLRCTYPDCSCKKLPVGIRAALDAAQETDDGET